jgi:hypothetical protein
MISRTLFRSVSLSLFCLLFAGAPPASADSSHARIIRLSLVQGDVRFARDFHGDPLADPNAAWEAAELNLPIRQGYVLATDKGRAEVEFENGAMAFLGENTVLEFYDLSLEDGAKTTRLVLRQGTASFYVNPADGDYFSVTGGDFTVQAADRTSFRLDNLDDGSSVNVLKGHVSVLRKDKTTPLVKGQSFSMRAGDDASLNVGRLPNDDDFDRWVSGRVDSVVTATTAAQQYVSSPYYSSGLADLYTYGSWYPVGGYGNCWRPYGVGLGWSPFANGGWFMDPVFGAAFIGNQPWGWLPYHYGGWIFDPFFGWLWTPGGSGIFYGGSVPWRPVTGVWVHSKKPGLVGIVPAHPFDAHGKAPINLAKGVFPVTGGAISHSLAVSAGEEWKVAKAPPRNTLGTTLVAAAPPTRTARTVGSADFAPRVIPVDRNSSIAYDPREHRFVNTNPPPTSLAKTTDNRLASQTGTAATQTGTQTMRVTGAVSPQHISTPPPTARTTVVYSPPVPRAMTPPPAPRSTESTHIGSPGSGSRFAPSSSSSAGSASHSPSASAPVSHAPSAPASGGHPH